MTPPARTTDPILVRLLERFPAAPLSVAEIDIVGAGDVPEPYKSLLVHHHHMTVTLEKHHGAPVRLVVHERQRHGSEYARRLRLECDAGGAHVSKVVLLGMMSLNLEHTSADVRRQILEESAPLGRILIEHAVLRWIQPQSYLRVKLTPELRQVFDAPPGAVETFGRVATIFCNGAPAVELLEVVCPEAVASAP